ncbi:MAG: peroxiredoxin [Bacteroidetes bacterium]|nr:peroxiredoxin [Bacteroidota bacterium]
MVVLVGKKAPAFAETAVVDGGNMISNFSLEQFVGQKNVLFFFYTTDFGFVCPTEILAFQKRLKEFEERDTIVVGCSIDSKQTHWAWLQTEQKEGGIKGVTFPLVADVSKTIAWNYGILAGDYESDDDGRLSFIGSPIAYRGLFLIDKQGIVRHQLINDLPFGRSVDEALRMVDALRFYEENGEVCPADWHEGDEGIQETHESIAAYLGKDNAVKA